VAQKFIDKGYDEAYALKGGWKEWSNAKFLTEPK
jgi:rhodanese-related sulfurtransferase